MALPMALKEQIQKAQEGDRAAQAWIVREAHSDLFRFCLLLAGKPEVASDLVQDTFIKGLAQLSKLKEAENLQAWLRRIARNLYIDLTRRQKFERLQDEPEKEITPSETPAQGVMEDLLRVRQILQKLPEDARSTLILIDLEGYSYGEASKLLGISETALASRLHRAREAFLKEWGE